MNTFSTFSLDERVLASLEQMGYKEPTQIQKEAIPLVLAGESVIGLAGTGSGKTAACAIPVVNQVDVELRKTQVLILVPTRELALQYATEVQRIGRAKKVRVLAVVGGESADNQAAKIKSGAQIVVATPGRLIDFIYSKRINLDHVKTFVLDEADEMLSMGFIEDIEFVFECIVQPHQTLLFSATMPPKIKALIHKRLEGAKEVILQKKIGSPTSIDQWFTYCHFKDREEELLRLFKEENPKQAIIFCQSRVQVESLHQFLRKQLPGKVDYLHAGMSQGVRSVVTKKYRSQKIQTLIATDVASRGLDFSEISHVFLFQLPEDPHLYVHRIGRTGRLDKKGKAISFVTKREIGLVDKITKFLKTEPKWLNEPPFEEAASRGNRNPRGGRNFRTNKGGRNQRKPQRRSGPHQRGK